MFIEVTEMSAEEFPPDLIVKLTVSPETSLQRKPDMKLKDILRRIKAVRFNRNEIDAKIA